MERSKFTWALIGVCVMLFCLIFVVSLNKHETQGERPSIPQLGPSQPPPSAEPKKGDQVCILAVVKKVNDVWTMNGDGGLVITHGGKDTRVSIIGYPSAMKETKITLKTVKYVSQLPNKKVKICGVVIEKDAIRAESLEEME